MPERTTLVPGSRYDSLDIWRGVACLLVLVHHSVPFELLTPQNGGGSLAHLNAAIAQVTSRFWIGVQVFFVISGYCISAAADAHRRRAAPLSAYFIRRFRRIFPPYWIVLATTAVVFGAGDLLVAGALTRNTFAMRPWWFSGTQWLGSISLTETWRPHLFGDKRLFVLGQAWTLCYEEQFYAVCGLLLLCCPRRFFLGASVVTAGVAAIALAAASHQIPIAGFFFDGYWLQFALGMLLYYSLNHAGVAGRRLAALTFVAVLAGAGSYYPTWLAFGRTPAQELFVASAFALIALLIRRFDSGMMSQPLLRPLRTCGVMCYSLYLVHVPLRDLIRAVLETSGVVTSTLSPFITIPLYGVPSLWVAWQFHVFVERRFMNSPVPAVARYDSTPLESAVPSR